MLERQTWVLIARVITRVTNSVVEPGISNMPRGWIFLLSFLLISISSAESINLPQYPPQDGYYVVDAFPTLTFEQPLSIQSPPGETNRLFVVERTGRIMVITNLVEPNASVFLDLHGS